MRAVRRLQGAGRCWPLAPSANLAGHGGTYADADQELVEVDMTITVGVEEGHEGVGLVLGDANADLAESRVELLGVDLVVSVERVEVSEGSAETSDGLGTSSLNLSPNLLES